MPAMLSHWFFSHSKVSTTHVRVLVPLLVLWFIWKSRNSARFEAASATPAQVIFRIEEFLDHMGTSHAFSRTSFAGDRDCPWARFGGPFRRDKDVAPVAWKKPPPGWLKLNTDASVLHGRASGGGVLRDHCGKVCFAYYKEFGELDVLEAEAQSLLHGLQLCADREVGALTVESNSNALVQLVCLDMGSKWPVCIVLREIKYLVQRMGASFHHVFREANSVADVLSFLQLGAQRVYVADAALPLRGQRRGSSGSSRSTSAS
ncbi:uncharacterized protein LOC113780450 [Coffea eugenioides]|uniref:uncharacterized protein LOC113780450 n=1 Tax=Coffea eugenioides TaxID=49369 RepID=UPI000F6087A7|nr:uncharacterized protein LOC113780450 [Coffea eugenioides]